MKKCAVTTNCEKSAEVIVGGNAEGLNNVTVESNVCLMEYPTAGKAKRT